MTAIATGCLRCPLAELLDAAHPHGPTDMAQRAPLIFCPLWGHARSMLFEGCPKAEEHSVRATRIASVVEDAYLRARYPSEPMAVLVKRLGRDERAVRHMADRRGLKRASSWKASLMVEASLAARQASGRSYSPSQTKYLLSILDTEAWPAKGGGRSPVFRAVQGEKKRRIVAEVARLGPGRSWASIQSHISYLQPGTQRARTRKRAQNQRSKDGQDS